MKLGLEKELKRIGVKKIRAGKGKTRGRKYKKKVGPLLIVSGRSKLLKGGRNLQGVDIINVRDLNSEFLAPGSNPGSLFIWSDKAIDIMKKDNLFYEKKK